MPYTEFTCRSGGNNLNAGTFSGLGEESVNPLLVIDSGTWVLASRTWTLPVASGDPRSIGIATGCFVSIYTTLTPPTTGAYIGRVSSMTATTVVIVPLHCAGLAANISTTAASSTMRVGGAWAGPGGINYFPFNLTSGAQLRNVNNNPTRINFKNNQTYTMATGIVANQTGPITYQGYTSVFEDKGRATIQGPTASGNFTMVSMGGAQQYITDFNIYNNGNAGTATFQLLGPMVAERILVSGGRANGIGSTTNPITCIDCIVIDCNSSNTASVGGFNTSVNGCTYIRCVSVRNNRYGWYATRQITLLNCISYRNTEAGCGILAGAAANYMFKNCDFFLNRTDGIKNLTIANGTHMHIENCRFIDNSGAAVNFSGVVLGQLLNMYNCYIGSGVFGNLNGFSSPQTGYFVPNIVGLQYYPLDYSPWADASGGNFTSVSAICRDAGYSNYPTGLTNMFTGTISYESVGAGSMRSNILMRRGEI